MGQSKLKRTALDAQRRQGPPPPPHLRHLPVDERGFIIPAFVQWFDAAKRATPTGTGTPDFRIVNVNFLRRVLKDQLCWICGNKFARGEHLVSVVGPMCTVNRTSSEPPSHRACARYAAEVCPFLTRPRMKRNEKELPEVGETPGIAIDRNPGVTALWTSRQVRCDLRTSLFDIGDPISVEWYCQGRPATRPEVMASFESGVEILRRLCELEQTPERRQDAYTHLAELLKAALQYLPPE